MTANDNPSYGEILAINRLEISRDTLNVAASFLAFNGDWGRDFWRKKMTNGRS